MFRSFVVDEPSQMKKNIQNLEKKYNMTVSEAVTFVKKRYPQFSNFWNDFETPLESSEAPYKQIQFQEAEATPQMHNRMNIMVLVLSALLLLATLSKRIGVSTETVPELEVVGDVNVLSRALVGQQPPSTTEKLADLTTYIKDLEASKELEEEKLKAQGHKPNLTPLYEITRLLKQKLQQLENLRVVAQEERDKRSGTGEHQKQRERATKKARIKDIVTKEDAQNTRNAWSRIKE